MRAHVVVLATGGTIAGAADHAADNLGYRAAAVPVGALLAALPVAQGVTLEAEQVAQIDSKDMDAATWQALAQRVAHHLGRPEVSGVVVTHGTDTLEETAWFLQRTLAPAKPVAMTAAMRPATSLQADGPQNLADAIVVAAGGAPGAVLAVLAGRVWPALGLRKLHPYRIDAFGGGDAGPLGAVREGRVRWWRAPAAAAPAADALLRLPVQRWPRVAMLTSHAGVDGALADAAVAAGFDALVVAGTGHATVHAELDAALGRARAQGRSVWITSRCTASDGLAPLPGTADDRWFTPAQARVELLVRLAERR